jgi:hypothetical protein
MQQSGLLSADAISWLKRSTSRVDNLARSRAAHSRLPASGLGFEANIEWPTGEMPHGKRNLVLCPPVLAAFPEIGTRSCVRD